MTGTIITFYSYKGGVGRSFTLANVAVLLARWGYRVLAIDWDLEAPGLHHYFAPLLPEAPKGGVVDLADEFLANMTEPRDHAVRLTLDDGVVDLLAAGRQDEEYTSRVQRIDWARLYDQGFAEFLERCRELWTERYDFVLIDSRTGISDIGGICTAHLPDRLVVLFTANDQSVDGAVDLARRADAARDRMPYDRQPHLVLPILSRLDKNVEYERAEHWQKRCAIVAAPLFRNWLTKSVSEELMLQHLTVPYVSYWSFGEKLSVLEETTPSAGQISFALETVAAVLAQQFDRTDLLADNRDAYVAAARTRGLRSYDLDLMVSSPRSAMDIANGLIGELRDLGLRVDRSLSGDVEFLDQSKLPARHLCLIVDGKVSRWQLMEAERFLRHALDSDDRQLFCVLTRDTEPAGLPAFLRNLRHLEFDTGMRPRDMARRLHDLITGVARHTDSDRNALRNAAAALRAVPRELPRAARWALVEQTVQEMDTALSSGDLALLKDLTVDLEVLNEVRANGSTFPEPAGLRKRITALGKRIDRRVGADDK
ncbi:CATRA system-associated protein [Labedaea rhizosphaerae]|uniref:CobQ/CobB/MinD/ParA family nucleotide binding protein n=1 Tax=Labedaea rhizosphaerae TaxID=598644 RepID=A0A4R6S827_LABRH|nr:CATRA system-associated protein [Labedaea rhizosphaerae]TDP94986.1 CobQ/CobB/MinD/ParA family nucleotide binding protein [Labedaea rhizosphaerae]